MEAVLEETLGPATEAALAGTLGLATVVADLSTQVVEGGEGGDLLLLEEEDAGDGEG